MHDVTVHTILKTVVLEYLFLIFEGFLESVTEQKMKLRNCEFLHIY